MAPKKRIDETLTSNTTSSTIGWDAGEGTFAAYGDFGGGTAKLQVSYDDGSTWIDAGNDATFTSDNTVNFAAPTGTSIRVELTGASSPSLEVEVMEIQDIVIEG